MPHITFDTLEAIPDALREYAQAKDGKFVVDVVPGIKLNEFRDRNIAVSQQLEAATGVLSKLKPHVGENIDEFVARLAEWRTMETQVKDGKLKATGDIEAEVNSRVGAMKQNYEDRLREEAAARAAAEGRATEADKKLNRSVVERHITAAVVDEKSGANASALADILTRAERVFTVTADGNLVAKNGDAIIYGEDGATPMTPLEWLAKLRKSAPYLFKGSNGGGASGNAAGQGTGYAGTGLTQEQFDKLSPMEKLRRAHDPKRAKVVK